MATLVTYAPSHRGSTAKRFGKVLADGIGDRYAIYRSDSEKLIPGCKVVLLRKDKDQRRAEGILVQLVERNRTDNGIQRYDVHIRGGGVSPPNWVECLYFWTTGAVVMA